MAEAKSQWLQGLMEHGINSIELIDVGLRKARASASPFMPSIGEFCQWCREGAAELRGLPDERTAFATVQRVTATFHEARQWHQYHPAIHWAYCQLDWYSVRQLRESEQRKAWAEVWAEAKRRAAEGFEFPPVPKPIEDQSGSGTVNRAAGEAALSNLKNMFEENNHAE